MQTGPRDEIDGTRDVSAEPTRVESRTVYDQVDERPVTAVTAPLWSPAQIVGLILGIFVAVIGLASLVRTGFDTSHIYRPVNTVWGLPHSPLFAVIEIAYGLLMILAAVVPGGSRGLMGLLGAVALAFGIVIVASSTPERLHHWLGVTHRNGWMYVIIGAIALVTAIAAPVFSTGVRRRHVRTVNPPA